MRAFNSPLKNQRGGGLLITMVTISMMILLLMSAATLKLAEVAKHAARANEQLRFMNAMDDLAQALARAHMLGKGTPAPVCPAGSTAAVQAGLRFCVPDTGSGGGAGLAGICADLDQNDATTHDRYCISALVAPTVSQNLGPQDPKELKFYANTSPPAGVLRRWMKQIFFVAHAHACNWWGGCPGGTGTAEVDIGYTVTEVSVPTVPALPGGAASELSASATASDRATMEPWAPNIATWAPNNELYIPNCAADAGGSSQYWWGCMRCDYPGVSCVKMTVCPASNSACAAADRYEQLIAIW